MSLGDRAQLAERASVRDVVRVRRLATAAEVAWLAIVPCALVTLLAMLLLGPTLGRLLPGAEVTPWPAALPVFRPEATEHGRYLPLVVAPLLLTAAIVLAARGRLRVGASVSRWVAGVQLLAGLFVVACFVSQHRADFETLYQRAASGTSPHTVYFTLATLAVACAIAAAAAIGIRDRRVLARARSLLRETPRRRTVAWAVVVLVAAIAVLPAIELEDTVMNAFAPTRYHLKFPLDETYAVLDGRSPLVDFAAQYGSLWPYALGGALELVGASVGAYTVLTSLLTALALISFYAVLRRVLGSAVAALLLFLPLLATSTFLMEGTSLHRYSLATLLGTFPLRLAGPCFLLLLTTRHLDGARPRSRVLLFAAGGLVVLNNADFGLPALGATAAALLWTRRPSPRSLAILAAEAVAGLCAAYAAVACLTLLRAGALPDLGLLVRYARLFTGAGFGMLPVKPLIGVSTIIYLTYVAAIATATVRAVGGASDRLLTGLLAWSGVFGIGMGAYYVGRSHPEVLINMFPAWAFCVTLLFALVVRRLAAQPTRLPTVPEVACLLGFGLLACSLAQLPMPWAQLQRLQETTSRTLTRPGEERFVAEHARHGEPVVILSMLGHRLAARAGVVNVAPYTGEESMPTREQLDETLEALRRAGGHRIFLPLAEPTPDIHTAIEAARFHVVAYDRRAGLAAFSDQR
jgi:hypothetical protein